MADLTTLARPYAKAAFEVARDNNDLIGWSKMLSLTASVSSNNTVSSVITSPTCTAEEQATMLLELCGEELDHRGRNFINLLAENKRLPLLPEISVIYEVFRSNEEKSIEVELTSAHEMSPEVTDKLATALKNRLQREINLTSNVDADLIGGVVIRAGDTVIDSSVRGKLRKLAESMNS